MKHCQHYCIMFNCLVDKANARTDRITTKLNKNGRDILRKSSDQEDKTMDGLRRDQREVIKDLR